MDRGWSFLDLVEANELEDAVEEAQEVARPVAAKRETERSR